MNEQSALVKFSTVLLLAWTTQVEGFLEYITHPEQFDIAFYRELMQRVDEQYAKWHVDPRYVLHDSIKDVFEESVRESKTGSDAINKNISKIKGMLEKCIEACKDKIRAKYWAAHAEERKKLEDEKNELFEAEQQKAKDIEEVKAKNAEKERAARDNIAKLEAAKKELGMFKLKEKKEAQIEIDAATEELNRIIGEGEEKVNKLKTQRESLLARIRAIDAEFKKDR